MRMVFKFLLLFVSALCVCDSYKILAIFHIPTKSHYILASKLVKELAKSGHEVTFITPYSEETPVQNLKVIPVFSLQNVFPVGSTCTSMFKHEDTTPLEKAIFVNDLQYKLSKRLISSNEFQTLLQSEEKYDAVLLYYYLNDALLSVAHHFEAPAILFASMPLYASENFLLSQVTPSSYVPNILTEYTGRMNFWQRLRNSFYDVTMVLYYQWFMLPQHKELVQEYIPGKPDLYQFLNNASLLLINSHVSTNEAVPVVPNAVEIGGYHIEEPKPLPQDLQKFLDESVNGVILFSMGSISRSVDIPKEKRDALIKAFSKLKENVLWKFEDEKISELPSNIKTMKWVPQSDVLAHPKVKAFISHGGLLSTMESVYHAVPIIGIPVFADQKMNIALAVAHEYAIEVPYQDLTEENLSHALEQILKDPKYKNNIMKRSKIMKDRPIKPLDNALYWIQYVIRHQGAPHLRYPGMDLNWFQRNLIDVVAFVVVVTFLPIFLIILMLKRVCKTNNKQKKD